MVHLYAFSSNVNSWLSQETKENKGYVYFQAAYLTDVKLDAYDEVNHCISDASTDEKN